MSILIFNRSQSFDFSNWLADSGHDLYLFTDRVVRDMHKYRGVEVFPSFDDAGLAEMRAINMASQSPFARILCHSEYDLVRAAALREHFALPGQNVRSAQAYRNKFLMKEMAAVAGIPIAPQVQLDSALNLLAFIEEHGLPVVVKPIDGGGSRGVEVLRDQTQVCKFLKNLPKRLFMAERFVAGQLYHIDGIAIQGEIAFATVGCYYADGCLNFHDQISNGSYLLEANSLRHRDLLQFTQQVIHALPSSPELGFHAEAFVTPEGQIVLCEIAARTAGAWVIEIIEAAYGINLNREWTRIAAGMQPSQPLTDLKAKRMAGWLITPPRPQATNKLPDRPPFEWCRSYINDINKVVNGATAAGSVEYASIYLVEGDTSEQVRQRLQELDQWRAGS
jgi:ATP-grasp domain